MRIKELGMDHFQKSSSLQDSLFFKEGCTQIITPNYLYRFSINLLYREWKRKKCSFTSIFITINYVNNASITARSQKYIVSCLLSRLWTPQKSIYLPYFSCEARSIWQLKSKNFSFQAISLSYHSFPTPSSKSSLFCNVAPLH